MRKRDQSTVELRERARSTRSQSLLLPTMVEYILPEVSVSMSEFFVLIVKPVKDPELRYGKRSVWSLII
jgi:virulence-associated protein VagC